MLVIWRNLKKVWKRPLLMFSNGLFLVKTKDDSNKGDPLSRQVKIPKTSTISSNTECSTKLKSNKSTHLFKFPHKSSTKSITKSPQSKWHFLLTVFVAMVQWWRVLLELMLAHIGGAGMVHIVLMLLQLLMGLWVNDESTLVMLNLCQILLLVVVVLLSWCGLNVSTR